MQFQDRIHRISQKADRVDVYYLIAYDTIEEEIASIIDKKTRVLTSILDGENADENTLLITLIKKYGGT